MKEKKLTAEEIVKKLNYIKEQYLSYIYNGDDECKVLFVDDIIDLIHRLQSENKELKSPKFASWKLKFFRLKEEFDKELSEHEEFTKKAKAEIERLTEYNENLNGMCLEFIDKNAELQKQVDKLKKENMLLIEVCDNCPKVLTEVSQSVKDTAREILQGLIEKAYVNECIDLTVAEVKAWFREDYGVEV